MATAALLAAAVVFPPACAQAPDAGAADLRIRLGATPSGWRTVDVKGLPAGDLAFLTDATLSRDEWAAILRVDVGTRDRSVGDRPPVLGVTAVSDGVLRFTPQFPLDPGQPYDVVFDPSSLPSTRGGPGMPPLTARLEVPAPAGDVSTHVVDVYPTGPEVPENHLRLYIVFSAPMGLSGGASHIRLLDDQGRVVPDPFLPLDLELWNENRTRFTVLYDPGRVKRGILPNEEMGRALVAGHTYTLVVDDAWRDAAGQPLAAEFRREFRVGPAREGAIDPADWRLDVPVQGTRHPLTVTFPAPLDYGLLHRALGVAGEGGRPLGGEIHVEQAETRWVFTPREPWRPGKYRLVALSILEDVSGNRIGRPFEVVSTEGRTLQAAEGASRPFLIQPPASP